MKHAVSSVLVVFCGALPCVQAAEMGWQVASIRQGHVEALASTEDGAHGLGIKCQDGVFSIFYRIRASDLEALGAKPSSLAMFVSLVGEPPIFLPTRAETENEEYVRYETTGGISRERLIEVATLIESGDSVVGGLARSGEGASGIVLLNEFPTTNASSSASTLRGVCDAYTTVSTQEGDWTILIDELGDPTVSVKDGSNSFVLSAWGCDITNIAYRLPSSALADEIATSKYVDITISKDGEEYQYYMDNMEADVEGLDVVFSFPQVGAEPILDLVASASSTVDIGIQSAEGTGPIFNLSEFSAAGSAKAVLTLQEKCQ